MKTRHFLTFFFAGIGTKTNGYMIYSISEKMLLNLDYNWYWLGNAFYQNASASTVSLNLGILVGQ